jgi:hypothetical protein
MKQNIKAHVEPGVDMEVLVQRKGVNLHHSNFGTANVCHECLTRWMLCLGAKSASIQHM